MNVIRTTSEAPSSPSPMRFYGWVFGVCLLLGAICTRFDFLLATPQFLHAVPGDLRRVFGLSELFAHGWGLVLIGVGVWVLVPDKRRYVPRILACAILPALAVQGIKLLIRRSRPISYVGSDALPHFPGSIDQTFQGWLSGGGLNTHYGVQSFPSGHTATVVGLAIGMSFVFPRGRYFFFVIAVLASCQRIFSLAHWGSDVFFGAAIAVLLAGELTRNRGIGGWLGRFEKGPRLLETEDQCEPISKAA